MDIHTRLLDCIRGLSVEQCEDLPAEETATRNTPTRTAVPVVDWEEMHGSAGAGTVPVPVAGKRPVV